MGPLWYEIKAGVGKVRCHGPHTGWGIDPVLRAGRTVDVGRGQGWLYASILGGLGFCNKQISETEFECEPTQIIQPAYLV